MLLEQPVLAVILVAIFLLVAYPVHEFAHAWAAYVQGDATAKLFGRLTLNPIVHFDKIGGTLTALSLLFSPILFGWAKPTPVNPANFKDRRNGDVIVALAGPVSNLLMALLGAAAFRLFDSMDLFRTLPVEVVLGMYYFVAFNVLLMVFNLIPIPPLDGSAILFRFLSAEQQWRIRPMLSQYGFILVLGVFLLGGRAISEFIFGFADVLVGVS
ncbi:MAG TPA: site-2 protease family protein [Candidatus Limnocylindrales bacterium]|nr:site-2 protease family protein [Candidatus Limnocylindrales bacterium]